MPKTLGTLLTQVRDRLDEATARQWTDAQLRAWINEGARDLARKCEVLQDRDDIAVVAGTREYTLPTDLIRVYRVEYRITGDDSVYPLDYKDFNNMDGIWWTHQDISENTPRYYTMWGFPPTLKIILYPTPAQAGTLKVFNYRLPAELATNGTADASNIEVPEGWSDVIVDFCEYMALRKDADPRWTEAKALYSEHIEDLFATSRRWTDQSGEFSVMSGPIPPWIIGDDY